MVVVLAYIGYFVGNNRGKVLEVSKQWGLYVLARLCIAGYNLYLLA